MSARETPQRAPRSLAILDHRGEARDDLRNALEDHGWQLRVSTDLESSIDLLRGEEFSAALILPLTLRHDTLEWQELLRLLSPGGGTPWLALVWEDAPAAAVPELVGQSEALADWMPLESRPAEVEARLANLVRLGRVLAAYRERTDILKDQLITDPKTGLSSEGHFRERLDEEFARTQRHGTPLTLLLLDLDDFKSVNDTTSYEFGDRVLHATGEALRHSVRSIDQAARLGGDEFAVLLPNTTLDEGLAVARRVRENASRRPVVDAGFHTELQLSIGLATYHGHGLAEARQLFLQANEALKEAKRAGKNRIQFFDPRRHASSGAPASSRAEGENPAT